MNNRSRNIVIALALLALLTLNLQPSTAHAQGTAFTYQGQLQNNGSLAGGTYNLQFTLYTNVTGGVSVAGPVTNSAVIITNGLFTVAIDFGAPVWNGATNWLQIGVETNKGTSFTALTPRQQITPAPYAIFAESGNAAGLTGTIPMSSLSGTYGGALSLTNPANTFIGNGSGLTGVNATTLDGLIAGNFWQIGGNSGVFTGFNYIGNNDDQYLDIHANGVRVMRLRLLPDVLGLYTNAPNIVGGSSVNLTGVDVVGAVIAGGGGNSTNGAPLYNEVYSDFGAIGGGFANAATGVGATVSGGSTNTTEGNYSVIGGGTLNLVVANFATAAGGFGNIVSFPYASAGGGYENGAEGSYDTAAGGQQNTAQATASAIGGGSYNVADANYATVAGGYLNTASGDGSFIGGGGYNDDDNAGNLAAGTASVVGGGELNAVYSAGLYATIAGGHENYINTDRGFIGGGEANQMYGGSGSVICGGESNGTEPGAQNSTVGGGYNNYCNGVYSTIPGGENNYADGEGSFAAGSYAGADYDGSFIWADDTGTLTSDTAKNQFVARASGGFFFYTGTGSSGAKLASGATAWTTLCDRNAKKNFKPVDTVAVLDKLATVPIEQWNYKWEKDTDTPNIGPMAQDFKAAFYPGRDDKGITTLEFDGVELAAIQGLNDKVEGGKAQIQELKAENAELKKELADLKALVQKLAQK